MDDQLRVRSHRPTPLRRGAVSPFVIVGLSVFVAAVALAVDTAGLWGTRVELRNGADAATLAAAQALVDDQLLTLSPDVMVGLLDKARDQAIAYARVNPVLGQPLELQRNPELEPLGDIVFGYLEHGRAEFQPATDAGNPHINAVRVIARRTRERGNPAGMYFARFFRMPAADVITTATALVDRDVVGFRPLGNKPLPLAPIALLSDPTLADDDSWEGQVQKPLLTNQAPGQDQYRFDRTQRRFVATTEENSTGDGIPELTIHMPLAGQPAVAGDEPNAAFIQIGDSDWKVVCRQINLGVTRDDLAEHDGQFALGWDNRLYLTGATLAPGLDDQNLGALLSVLKTLQLTAEPRIWPLFSQVQQGQNGEHTVVIQGFVAARLISVEIGTVGEGTPEDPKRQELNLKLQPCMLATGTALTDHSRRRLNLGIDLHNPYLCKVRLVE